MRVHESHKKIIVIVFFGIVSIAAVTTGLLIQSNRNTSSSKASSVCNCTDNDVCYPDGCSRKPKTDDNRFDEDRYDEVCRQFDPGYRMPEPLFVQYCSVHQPDCCADILKYGDSRLCCWQERYVCHPSFCEGSSGGDGCGKYWDVPRDDWNDYGCVKRDSNNRDNIIPKYGVAPNIPGSQPTSTPQPTATPRPTATPTTPPQATATPRPANTATPNPSVTTTGATQTPSATTIAQQSTTTPQASAPTSPAATIVPSKNKDTVLPPFELPKFQPPKIALRDIAKPENIEKVNDATDPPLTAVKDTFVAVKKYDQELESFIESYVKFFYSGLKNFLR